MKKIKHVLKGLFILALPLLSTQCNYKDRTQKESLPKVVSTTNGEVYIQWNSPEAYEGKVRYKKASIKRRMRPNSSKDPLFTKSHHVYVRDLPPSTLYTYYLKRGRKKYTFLTEPNVDTPLSFIISGADSTQNLNEVISTENCGFLIGLKNRTENSYSNENAYVPVYYMDGSTPHFDGDELPTPKATWKYQWGNIRLAVINKETDVKHLFTGKGEPMVGVIINTGVISGGSNAIQQSSIHQQIVANNTTGEQKVAFVGIVNGGFEAVEMDGVNYFSISKDATAVVHIINNQASVYFPKKDQEIALAVPAENEPLECTSCKRLAQRGEIEKSIEAYQNFITSNSNYILDDTYFSIAQLMDKRLYTMKDAHVWYQAIVDSFPGSAHFEMASKRIRYLNTYSDCYQPLERFSSIKDQFYASNEKHAKQCALLEEAHDITEESPNCNITPDILLWAANQSQNLDGKKALKYYNELKEKHPEYSDQHEVDLKIAQTYFEAGDYGEASDLLEELKESHPKWIEKIDSQLQRIAVFTTRNLLRNLSWISIVLLVGLIFLIRPSQIVLPKLSAFTWSLAAYFVAYLALFIESGNEIVEILDTDLIVVIFFFEFLMLFYLTMIVFKSYQTKWNGYKIAGIPAFLLALIFIVCGFYLLFYYQYDYRLEYINL